jgi:hypothetical protein
MRWAHTRGVGLAAESIAHIVDSDADLLVCAAWLHDIGYAPGLATTGFHALDGARYLRDVERTDPLLYRLVAHHSCAAVEARNRGLAEEFAAEFAPVDGLVADALTYCDMTTGPGGQRVSVDERLSEIASRYGDGSIVAESMTQARASIVASVRIVTTAMSS